jgi:hypothetical protein
MCSRDLFTSLQNLILEPQFVKHLFLRKGVNLEEGTYGMALILYLNGK